MAELYNKDNNKDKDLSDSDIICNGGYPFLELDVLPDAPPPTCGGLTVDRVSGDYEFDSPQRLWIKGGSVKAVRFPEVPSFDLTGRNWHIFIYPHLVILHTRDAGTTVEIKCPDGFQKLGGNTRRHPDKSEIESMILVVNKQCYLMSGCKFTLEYR